MSLLPDNRDHGWAPYVWLVFRAFFFFQPVLGHASANEWILTGAVIAVFIPLYFGIFWVKPPITYLLLCAMAVMGMGLAHFNPGASVFIIYCSSFIPWIAGPTRRALPMLASLLLVLGGDAAFFGSPGAFWGPPIVVAMGVAGFNIQFSEK